MRCIWSRDKGGWKGRTPVLKQQDLQRAVLLGANKVDIYRSTTAASAWAKNTLSDIFGARDTELLADTTMPEITQTELMPPHLGEIAVTVGWIKAKLSVAIVISTDVLFFQFSRWELGNAPSPLKDRSSCVCLYDGVAGTVLGRGSILWR